MKDFEGSFASDLSDDLIGDGMWWLDTRGLDAQMLLVISGHWFLQHMLFEEEISLYTCVAMCRCTHVHSISVLVQYS